jgi:hypothetical protein
MIQWGIFLAFFLFGTELAEAGPLARACSELVEADRPLLKKCVSHSEFFELNSAFINECTKFHKNIDIRMKCLKSGANLEILQVCKTAKWSIEGTLTCLRSYPTDELMRSCKKISSSEEDQIRCVRSGADHSQVESCLTFSNKMEQRFRCMKMDVPSFEAKRCERISNSENGRFSCLQDFIASRERDYREDQAEVRGRMLASESEPVYMDVDSKSQQRMPASKKPGIELLK